MLSIFPSPNKRRVIPEELSSTTEGNRLSIGVNGGEPHDVAMEKFQ